MSAPALYGTGDPLGCILSRWRVSAVVPLLRDGTLVDLACGDNRLVRQLGRGTGLDITDHGADLIVPDFSCLPFAAGSIDTVTILAALNYFDAPALVLTEVARILKDDGVLIITLLHKPLSAFWHRLRDRDLPRIAYSEAELVALLAATPLRIAARSRFMLGLNRAYLIRKPSVRQTAADETHAHRNRR